MSEHQPTTQTERERAYGQTLSGNADPEFAKRLLDDFEELLHVLDVILRVTTAGTTLHQARLDTIHQVVNETLSTARSRAQEGQRNPEVR